MNFWLLYQDKEKTGDIPKSISRLKNQKDQGGTITGARPPKRSRSSRFNVTERIELEKLPSFSGKKFE